MSDKSLDLSSTPADSTRLKTRRGKKMTSKDTNQGQKNEVFKVPDIPNINLNSNVNSTKTKVIRIKSVAERKTDLLSRWSDFPIAINDKGVKEGVGDYTNTNMPGGDNATSKSNSATAVKLSKFKYISRGINEGADDDEISLGESAQRTQAKMKHARTDLDTDYDEHDSFDGDSHDQRREADHGEGVLGYRYEANRCISGAILNS